MFVSSSRLLSRPKVRWLDPLIGHSVLVGVLAGALEFTLRAPLQWQLKAAIEGMPPDPLLQDLTLLRGQREALGLILDQAMMVVYVLIHVAALVVIRYLVKRRLPTLALTLVAWILISGDGQPHLLAMGVVVAVLEMFVLLRWGVVALAVAKITAGLCWHARAADWSAWHAEGPLLVLAALALLVVYGAWAATGGGRSATPQPLESR